MSVYLDKSLNSIQAELNGIRSDLNNGVDPSHILVRLHGVCTRMFKVAHREMQLRTQRVTDESIANNNKIRRTHNALVPTLWKIAATTGLIAASILGGHAFLSGAEGVGKMAQMAQTALDSLSRASSIAEEGEVKTRVKLNLESDQLRNLLNQHYQSGQGDKSSAEASLRAAEAHLQGEFQARRAALGTAAGGA